MDTGVFVALQITKVSGTKVKEACIVVDQFLSTFDPDNFFVFISETYGELCGDGVVTFTGYGPRFHFSNHDKFQLGPATCLFHDLGVGREATVEGTITGLVEPFGTLTFGGISDQSSTALSHGGECSR